MTDPVIIRDIEQGSPEWRLHRVGHITASRFVDLLAVDKNGQAKKARTDLLDDVILERYTGEATEGISAKSLAWGNDVEGFGRVAYEAEKGVLVERVALIIHPTLNFLRCSPDGLVPTDPEGPGGLELKCPITKRVHLDTLKYGMPREHEAQVQGNLLCSRRRFWDFASFHPQFPPESRLFIQRVRPDLAMHAKIEQAAADLNEEANEWLERLRRRFPKGAA